MVSMFNVAALWKWDERKCYFQIFLRRRIRTRVYGKLCLPHSSRSFSDFHHSKAIVSCRHWKLFWQKFVTSQAGYDDTIALECNFRFERGENDSTDSNSSREERIPGSSSTVMSIRDWLSPRHSDHLHLLTYLTYLWQVQTSNNMIVNELFMYASRKFWTGSCPWNCQTRGTGVPWRLRQWKRFDRPWPSID